MSTRRPKTSTPIKRIHRSYSTRFLEIQWGLALRKSEHVDRSLYLQNQIINGNWIGAEEYNDAFNIPDVTCREYRGGDVQCGYPVIKVRTDREVRLNTNLELYKLAVLSKDWDDNNPIFKKKNTASHLCHNKRCINPEHLTCEALDINTNRRYCKAWVVVDGVPVHICSHKPKCLVNGPSCF